MKKNIFISGVSQGIGKEIALYHLKEGDNVYGISRNSCSELIAYKNFFHKKIDLSEFETISLYLDSFEELKNIRNIDTLYLNAGLIKDINNISEVSIKDFHYTMSVNLYSYKVILDYFLNNSFFKLHQIVISSSIAGVRARAGMTDYAISKAALNMMIKLYALEHPSLFFNVIGLCVFDSNVSRTFSSKNPKIKKFPDLDKLSIRLKEENYVVTAKKRAYQLINVLKNSKILGLESGKFVEIRDLLTKIEKEN
ncbi:SDR family NAD(P)-dependent oxidoreductase [Acinetobacter pittii]|uniref:SDR family NAD(P)-dependent oxidoreductase n=1 Tax=Acinetobacter pittii TaxID=48296 RepID=UPI00326024E5